MTSADRDSVTFSITLPAGGSFEEQLEALRAAKAEQLKLRNRPADEALHTILVLAERGALAFMKRRRRHCLWLGPYPSTSS
jgi:hypothetical protein